MWKVKAIVKLKEGVLDVQGRAVEGAMKQLGYSDAKGVKVGKYIEFLSDEEPSQALLKEMGDRLLANPVIESVEFSLECLASASAT